MDKRGFHRLFMGVILTILVVLLTIYMVVTPRTSESLHKLTQTEVANTETKTAADTEASRQTQQTKEPDPDQHVVIKKETMDLLYAELKPHKYSEDPYLEARSIVAEHAFCFAVDDVNVTEHLQQAFNRADRRDLFNQIQQQCQATRSAYPTLQAVFDDIYLHLKPTSHTGRLLQQMLKRQDGMGADQRHNEQTLRALLNSQNGPILAEQAGMPFMFFTQGEPVPISQWIGSRNNQYIEQLFQLSLTRLACRYQGGAACQPHGMAMLMLCSGDSAACGLDFQSYYQQNILPGIQKDVDILVEKFEAMVE